MIGTRAVEEIGYTCNPVLRRVGAPEHQQQRRPRPDQGVHQVGRAVNNTAADSHGVGGQGGDSKRGGTGRG